MCRLHDQEWIVAYGPYVWHTWIRLCSIEFFYVCTMHIDLFHFCLFIIVLEFRSHRRGVLCSVRKAADIYWNVQSDFIQCFFVVFLYSWFLLHGAVLAWVLAMALFCLSVCVCLSQVGVLSKQTNKLNWFLVCELPSTYLNCVKRKFWYLQK